MMRRAFTIAALLGCLMLMEAQPAADGAQMLVDLLAHWQSGQTDGLLSPTVVRTVRSGGVARQGGFLHPTQKPARILFKLNLPAVSQGEKLVLLAWAGLDDNIPEDDPAHPWDGVRARLMVNQQPMAEVDCAVKGWQPLSADLSSFGGQTVNLEFVVEGKANTHYDWAYIAEPRLLRLRERFAHKVARLLPPEGVLELESNASITLSLKPVYKHATEPHHPTLQLRLPARRTVWLEYGFQGAYEATLEAEGEAPVARVYPYLPRLRLRGVYPRVAVLRPGETVELSAIVQNSGMGTWRNDMLRLEVNPLQDVQVLDSPDADFTLLSPGESRVLRFTIRVGARPKLALRLRSAAGNDAVILTPVVSSLPAGVPERGRIARRFGEHLVLQNEWLRLVASPAWGSRLAVRLFGRQGERWVQLASMPTVADAILNAENAPPKSTPFVLESASFDEVNLRLSLQGRMGLVGRAHIDFRLVENRLESTAQLTSTVNAHLYRFRFPDWRVGDGSFGERKEEALFPGLEYLLDGERSSGEENAAPPYHLRFSPHPYKVTVPMMAVRWRNWLISLHWDAQQGWSGVLQTPNALFLSPDWLEHGAFHRFALWVPTIPRWADENSLQAREPFRLLKGDSVRLSATLVVQSAARDISEAIESHLRLYDMPYPPAPQRNDSAALTLSLRGLLNSWDPNQRAWRHTNTGPTYYDPLVALGLWVLAHRQPPDNGDRARAIQQVRSAIEAIAPESMGWEMAFYLGRLPLLLASWERATRELLRTQRQDGSWAWQPTSERHRIFGKAGDTSSGHTGEHAARVGRYALVTLEPDALQSLQRALRFLEKQRRPEGAQTWELPLHVPDVLAVPHCVNALLDGYEATGEASYLQQARRWALRGIPFLYLWNAPDRPLMRGASIPVFGVTWLSKQPWFGVAVQWNGLVYAHALYRLAEYDRTLEWRRLADTITLCAVQQQEWITERYPSDEGFYPDAFSIPRGTEEYHWDLNPRLIPPALARKMGFALEPLTRVVQVEGRRVAVTAPGLKSVALNDGQLAIQLEPPAAVPALFVFISGLSHVEQVRLADQPLPQVADMDTLIWQEPNLTSGWTPHTKGVFIRLINPPSSCSLQVAIGSAEGR
jgi:hypothetical protein